MAIAVYAAPATEPLTIAEVMAHLRMDVGNQEPAPGTPSAALIAPAAAGNVDNGLHRYVVTFVTAAGETQAGTVSAGVTVADRTVNGKVALTNIPLGGAAVIARKLYRTAAAGSTYLALATIADNTTTSYTDNVSDASLGAGAPAVNTTDDPGLSVLVSMARQQAETLLHRYLVTQTLDAYFDAFPGVHDVARCARDPYRLPDEIRLPPLQSVTEITYLDTNGVTQVLAADQYLVDAISQPARVVPAYGCSWPSTRAQANAVKVRFIAGYGAASAVPKCVKQWMLMRIGTLWKQRNEVIVGTLVQRIPEDLVDSLLDSERVWGLA